MRDGATLHMIGNAHLGPVWLWQWAEGLQEAKATFRSALDRLNESPDFIFTSSSTAIHDWVEENFSPYEIKTFRVPDDETQPVVETNLIEDVVPYDSSDR